MDEQFAGKCSICFSNDFDFFFNGCKDQFCYSCFSRYIETAVENSWGYSSNTKAIQCPSCMVELETDEWMKHIDDEVLLRKWNENFKPFRVITSNCVTCHSEIAGCPKPIQQVIARKQCYEKIYKLAEKMVVRADGKIDSSALQILTMLAQSFNIHFGGGLIGISDIYHTTMYALTAYLENMGVVVDQNPQLADLSRHIVSLETEAKKWQSLQLNHISTFSKIECSKCLNNQCFLCSVSPFHDDLSCQQHIQNLIDTKQGTPEELENLNWKITSTKSCPQCKIRINRDEGCNSVKCLFCGTLFCWQCLGTDPKSCSYYKCHQMKLAHSPDVFDFAEAGVPNIDRISRSI